MSNRNTNLPAINRAHHSACRRAVPIKPIAIPPIERRQHDRVALEDETEMAKQSFVQDRVDDGPVVGAARSLALHAYALRWNMADARDHRHPRTCCSVSPEKWYDHIPTSERNLMATLRARMSPRSNDAALLTLTLDRNSRLPLVRQLYLEISEHIRSGRLTSGARLPSTRALADELNVSRTITLTAYGQLSSEGYIESRRGSGQYVRLMLGTETSARRTVRRRTDNSSGNVTTALDGRPFDPWSQFEHLFPQASWTTLLGRSWRRDGRAAVSSANWSGLSSLRAAIARYVFSLRGIECAPDQVLITSGNTDALQLIADALLPAAADRKAGAWVENPGHIGARQVLSQRGVRLVPVSVDEFGMDVEAGWRIAPNARMALVTPSRQFPLGMPLSLPRRIMLAKWAREKGAIIVEDDYDTEVRFTGRPIASIVSLDPDVDALSLGSFSKLTFSGLRLGYIVGSHHLIARLAAARALTGVPVATTAQPALAEFIECGMFAKHLRTLRRQLGTRRASLIVALQEKMIDHLAILPQEVGMHLTVALNDCGRSDSALARRAAENAINVHALSAHYLRAPRRSGFLLGYAGWDQTSLSTTVANLSRVLDNRDRRHPTKN